jgi:hypothetical protein
MKDKKKRPYTKEDILALRVMVRSREDFQQMRKSLDNRLGRKANGEEQNIEERAFRPEDAASFVAVSDEARRQEKELKAKLSKMLARFPIYTDYLKDIRGIDTIIAANLIAAIDIEKATTVSKIWQYAGLNPGMVLGWKRKTLKDGTVKDYKTTTLIKGDSLTPKFLSPYNKRLRCVLLGVLGKAFITGKSPYAFEHYYPYKARLEQSDRLVKERRVVKEDDEVEEDEAGAESRVKNKKQKPKTELVEVKWKDASRGHRDRAAQRKMIKAFLADLYVVWRKMEGLPVRPPYSEEFLGKKHAS